MDVSKAIEKLQKRCMNLTGENISFRILYWGAHPNHQDNPFHKHSFFEICYVNSGTGLYFEEGQNYKLQKGTFICSRPEKLHRIYEGEDLSLFWIGFEVNMSSSKEDSIALFDQLGRTKNIIIHDAASSPTAQLWNVLMKHGESTYSSELLCSLSHSLLLSIQTLFCGLNKDEEIIKDDDRSLVLIKQAQLFIKDNLSEPLSLEEVAQYLYISKRHLTRLFKKHMGLTFTTFLRQERVNASAVKLRETDLSIKEISEIYCFSSIHYFTRVFSEEIGLTPGEYRKLTK